MRAGCFQPSDFRDTTRTFRCYHSGDLGDIVYSMQFCRSLGEVELILGPDPAYRVRDLMSKGKFEWFAPLLRRQPFVQCVEFMTAPPQGLDFNLNEFRRSWFSAGAANRKDKQLAAWYFEHFKRPLPADEPWLVADPSPDSKRPIIINRTGRWLHPKFPWHMIRNTYADRMVFIGAQSEYDAWVREFGGGIEYRPVTDALDMANIIAGGQCFIGNQSLPMAIALGLGVPLIQESCPGQHDCVFPGRRNAQFTHTSINVTLPTIEPMKRVVTHPTRKGLIELGPFEGAPGIGDTLMITPLARALGEKAIMILPPDMERLSFMFHGLCPVEIKSGGPTFAFQKGLQSSGLLRMFNRLDVSPIPRINIDPTSIPEAKRYLAGINNPIAFTPTCSRHWINMRQRPPRFWEPIIAKLSERYTVLQFGMPDYPLLKGAVRMPFMPVSMMAAVYHLIGTWVGTHTGDYHLMVAVDGRVVVADPDPWPEAEHWTYNAPKRVQYAKLSHPNTVLAAMEKLGI